MTDNQHVQQKAEDLTGQVLEEGEEPMTTKLENKTWYNVLNNLCLKKSIAIPSYSPLKLSQGIVQ